ncbi:MAG: DUF4838 domain-containing protein [Candidatus Hydrogenedentes bacterium]|nr:DUF4838 domain-containing protein [Candidatus Hydrogenedentota bacterium]
MVWNRLSSRVLGLMVMTGLTAAFAADPSYLLRNGASAYSIVVGAQASPSELKAAESLQTSFKECAGVTLPIVNEPKGPFIAVGFSPATEALGIKAADFDLGEQGYLMRTVPPNLVIAGTPAAGTLYGVYDFVEQHLGERWYAPGVTKRPACSELALPTVDTIVKPAFLWRHTSYTWPGKDDEFQARVRDNAGGGGVDNPFGVQHAHAGRAHSYFNYVSPEEFYDTHPEYFAEVGGKRLRFETQLCLSNPDVLEIATERMLQSMKDRPEYRQYNFSQMDYYNYCECPRCTEINERYGTTGGTQFWFVNQLAERTSKVYPDKLVGTLAYTFTEEPPKGLDMHPNVAVWLCHMFPSCDSHPIATCPLNADYKRRAQAWAKQCSHLYIWHYIVDFAHYFNPFPNLRAMAADMRFYRDIGVEGLYLQAMGHGGGGGEWSLLRPYYGMKLIWNPDQNPDAILKDFLQGYYGAAGEPLWQYVTLLHDKVEREDIHMHLYTNPAQGYLPDELLARAGELFDQAEEAVRDDDELLERVRVARMPLVYARWFPRNGMTVDGGTVRFNGPFASPEEIQEFLGRCAKHGFQAIREWGGDPQQMVPLGMAIQTPLPLATIQNEALVVDTLPTLGGRVLRITDKASGQCITAYNRTKNLFFPFEGGEETRMGGLFVAGMLGNMEPYAVTAQTPTSVTMEAVAGQTRLIRTATLEDGAPRLKISVEAVNTADKPAEILLHSHLELDLGDLAATRVQLTDRSGKQVEVGMDEVISGMREGKPLRREQAPKGSWTFSGSKGLQVTQSFDDSVIDFAVLTAYPDTLEELEVDLWRTAADVPPGKSITFSHTVEVVKKP